MLWHVANVTRHGRRPGHPLRLRKSPAVMIPRAVRIWLLQPREWHCLCATAFSLKNFPPRFSHNSENCNNIGIIIGVGLPIYTTMKCALRSTSSGQGFLSVISFKYASGFQVLSNLSPSYLHEVIGICCFVEWLHNTGLSVSSLYMVSKLFVKGSGIHLDEINHLYCTHHNGI